MTGDTRVVLPSRFTKVFEPDRLEAVGRLGVMGSGSEPVFDVIVRHAAEACRTSMAFLTFLDDRRQWIKAGYGGAAGETTLDRAVCAAAIEHDGDLFVVPDCHADPRVNWSPAVWGDPPIAFYAGVLLRDGDGRALGTLCVADARTRPGGLDGAQVVALRRLAATAMSVLEYRRDA